MPEISLLDLAFIADNIVPVYREKMLENAAFLRAERSRGGWPGCTRLADQFDGQAAAAAALGMRLAELWVRHRRCCLWVPPPPQLSTLPQEAAHVSVLVGSARMRPLHRIKQGVAPLKKLGVLRHRSPPPSPAARPASVP
jgi:hypothetical protein